MVMKGESKKEAQYMYSTLCMYMSTRMHSTLQTRERERKRTEKTGIKKENMA